MKKSTAFLVGLGLLASLCRAEPRWCSVVSNDPSNKLIYPPIARAARVPGVVLVHMIYAPNGKVVRVEPISGPRLLSSSLAQQMMDWTVRTDASGDELCETLVIAKFTMLDSGQAAPKEPSRVTEPSILRLSVETEPFYWMSRSTTLHLCEDLSCFVPKRSGASSASSIRYLTDADLVETRSPILVRG